VAAGCALGLALPQRLGPLGGGLLPVLQPLARTRSVFGAPGALLGAGICGACSAAGLRGPRRGGTGARPGCGGQGCLLCGRRLLVPQRPAVALTALAPGRFGQGALPLLQGVARAAGTLAGAAQASVDGELPVAGGLLGRQALVDGGALLGRILGKRIPHQGATQRHEGHPWLDAEHHVKPVSTSRRSSARYSLDCISFKREIVRGNSCARGPSV